MDYPTRHLHHTILKLVTDGLTAKGWVNDPVNFGTAPVTFTGTQPYRAGTDIAVNTVAVTLGDADGEVEEEMGGGLMSTSYAFFVDVFAENQSIAYAITDDIRSILSGKVRPVYDFTQDPLVESGTHTVEFEDVGVDDSPAGADVTDRHWRVVFGEAVMFYLA